MEREQFILKRLIRLSFILVFCLSFLGGCKGGSGKEAGQITRKIDLQTTMKEEWKGEIPVRLTYCRNHETSEVYETGDEEMISRMAEALSNVEILEETDVSATDSDDILVFEMQDGRKYSICFEGGMLLQDEKRYIVEGFNDVDSILRELAQED